MAADEKLEPGVRLRPEPCYTIIVVGSDEGPDFEGGFSHYIGEVEAATAVVQMQADRDDDDTRVLEIVPEEFCCTQAVSLCGTLFIYEGDEYQSHFVDRQNLTDCMEVWAHGPAYWQITPDGAVLCDQIGCPTCYPNPSGDPLTIPVPPTAGQLPLEVPGV